MLVRSFPQYCPAEMQYKGRFPTCCMQGLQCRWKSWNKQRTHTKNAKKRNALHMTGWKPALNINNSIGRFDHTNIATLALSPNWSFSSKWYGLSLHDTESLQDMGSPWMIHKVITWYTESVHGTQSHYVIHRVITWYKWKKLGSLNTC